jgi:hypothetical protein
MKTKAKQTAEEEESNAGDGGTIWGRTRRYNEQADGFSGATK